MKNQPLLVSVIIGIIVVFVIVGASLVSRLSSVSKRYKRESVNSMKLEKENETLKTSIEAVKEDNAKLKEGKKTLESVIEGLKNETEALKAEIDKLNKVKEALEDKLNQELIKAKEPLSKNK